MKFTEKTQLNQFLSFPIISSSNESRGSASHWGMNTSGIGQCHMFSIFFSKCQKRNSRKRTKKNQFLSFQIISSPNEPRGRASHWGMNTSEIGQCHIFFDFFLNVRNEIYGKNPIKSIFEFSNYI